METPTTWSRTRGSRRSSIRRAAPPASPVCAPGFTEGVERDGLELRLERGGSLEGRLLTAEGVQARGKAVGVSADDAHAATQVLGADGAYRFERLRPGRYQVRTCNPEYLGRLHSGTYLWADPSEPVVFDVEVRAGEVARFDLDQRDRVPARLCGTLTLGGTAPAGWSCNIASAEDDTAFASIGADGSFDLRVSRPGSHWFNCSGLAGPARAWFHQPIELAPGENYWTRDFPTGTVVLANVPAFSSRA